MMNIPWLPSLLQMSSYGGNWPDYLTAIYGCFYADFIMHKPLFMGRPVWLRNRKRGQHDYEERFWHLITRREAPPRYSAAAPLATASVPRNVDPRRCERIGWPRAIIEAVPSDELRVWREQMRDGTHIQIATADFSYLVVLSDEPNVRLITAFCAEYHDEERRLCERFERGEKDAEM